MLYLKKQKKDTCAMINYSIPFALMCAVALFHTSCSTSKNKAVSMSDNTEITSISRPAKPLAPIFNAYSPKGEWLVNIQFDGKLDFTYAAKGIKFSVPAPEPFASQPSALSYKVSFDNGDEFVLTIFESLCGKSEWGREMKIEGVHKGERMEDKACGRYLEVELEKKSALWFVEEVNDIKSDSYFEGEEPLRVEINVEAEMVYGIFGCRRFKGMVNKDSGMLMISFLQAPNMDCNEGPKATKFLMSIENEELFVTEKGSRLFLKAKGINFVLHKID
jgi:hypothetical protein